MVRYKSGSGQTKLYEPDVTDNWPVGHKTRRPKEFFLDFHKTKEETTESILEKIEELMPGHKPIVMWSGGKDGRVVLDKVIKAGKDPDVFYIRTNTGVQITEDFLRDQCKKLGLRLHIREPTPWKYVYTAICLEIGFPGPQMHDLIMRALKEQTMWKFIVEPMFKKRKAVLYSGVRKFESLRRMGNYDYPINVNSGKMWFTCPIFYMTNEEVYKYFTINNLKKSPSYDVGHSSMECECGCFAGFDEIENIRKLDPLRAEYFEWLTVGVKKFGTKHAKRHSVWGGGDWSKKEVDMVLSKFFNKKELEHIQGVSSQICGAECGAGTMRGSTDF